MRAVTVPCLELDGHIVKKTLMIPIAVFWKDWNKLKTFQSNATHNVVSWLQATALLLQWSFVLG